MSVKNVAIILFVSSLVVGGMFLFANGKSAVKGETTIKNISLNELSLHSSKKDCWMAINGNVYDITKFIPLHPGGESIVRGCGTDSTKLFNGTSLGGRRHSSRARDMLMNLVQVGELAS